MPNIQIRRSQPRDSAELRQVFIRAIRETASAYYGPEQIAVWAPTDYDKADWQAKLDVNRPFIAEINGEVAGFADLIPGDSTDSGYIDFFYVSPVFGRMRVGTTLMVAIVSSAKEQGFTYVNSHVSLAAQSFYRKFGFHIVEHQKYEFKGVVFDRAHMRIDLRA